MRPGNVTRARRRQQSGRVSYFAVRLETQHAEGRRDDNALDLRARAGEVRVRSYGQDKLMGIGGFAPELRDRERDEERSRKRVSLHISITHGPLLSSSPHTLTIAVHNSLFPMSRTLS